MSPRRANSSDRPRPKRQPAREPWALARRQPESLGMDEQRYLLHTGQGLSIAEIAARENVRLPTVQASIDRIKLARARFSQESLEHTVRRSVIEAAPTAHAAIISALTATCEKLKHLGTDDETGEPLTAWVEVADHQTRMMAITKLTALIESIKEESPMVSIQNQNLQQNAILAPGQVSIESIIREVRAEKGLAIAAETTQVDVDAEPLPDRTDFELQAELAKEAEFEEAQKISEEPEADASPE